MLPFKRRRRRAELLLLLAAALAIAAFLLQHAHGFQQPVSTARHRLSTAAAGRAWISRRRMGVQRAAMAVESDVEEEQGRDGEEEATKLISLWWQPAVPTTRFVARVAYEGTKFNGWQYQVKSRTVQLEVERALNATLPLELREQIGGVRTVAAGRTDSGVHARGQALHFDLPTAGTVVPNAWDVAPGKLGAFLNHHLPPDVRLWNVSLAPPPVAKNLAVNGRWHAMYNAVGKLYTYRFSLRSVADPLERRTRAHVPPRAKEPGLDVQKLVALAPLFEGTHDFQNFANRLEHKRRASKKGADFTTERTVYRCRLVDEGAAEEGGAVGHYRLEVHLKGALQRMVRNMMGGLWAVARGDLDEAELRRALEGPMYPTGRSPIRAAPAHGLTLEWVYYDDF